MSQKTIKINPELFKLGGNKNKTMKNSNGKNLTTRIALNKNLVKQKLIEKIQQHKIKENNSSAIPSTSLSYTINDEFNESVNFLSSLAKSHNDKKLKKERKKLLNNNNITMKKYENTPVSLDLSNDLFNNAETNTLSYINFDSDDNENAVNIPPEKVDIIMPTDNTEIKIKTEILPEPAWGCLKKGLKPTYRTWNSTRKNYNSLESKSEVKEEETRENIIRTKRLEELKKKLNLSSSQEMASKITDNSTIINGIQLTNPNDECEIKIEDLIPKENEKITKITTTKKYNLGKKNGKVGVLLKNNTTRKLVNDAYREIRKTPINTIKNYLKKHGFIKVGSTAPNDIIRQTYESTLLTGDISNVDKEILLHNILNDKTDD